MVCIDFWNGTSFMVKNVKQNLFVRFFLDSILQTSCKELNNKNETNLKKNVSIRFEGEQGMVY